jgi:hypothetical protein
MSSTNYLDEQELFPRDEPISDPQATALRGLGLAELLEQCEGHMQAYRRGEPSTDVYGIELLRRATTADDREAWTALQEWLSEVVRGWLRGHPSREVALRLDSEENYVAQAFERFWWATTQSQQIQFRSLAAALQYLRASLHGALLDAIRAYVRPGEFPLPEPGDAGEPGAEDRRASQEFWEVIQRLLPDRRDQRLAYLLFHCGLKPREIVRFCPQEFHSVEEIYRLRRSLVERLARLADSVRWQLSLS